MTPDAGLVDVLVQGGAVGLAILALFLLGYVIRVLTNHLTHVATTLDRLPRSMNRMARAIERLEHRLDTARHGE